MTKVNTFNGQCLVEEILNSVSHGLGAMLAIAGTVILILTAIVQSDAMGVVSMCLYGSSMIILYAVSSLYHAMVNYKVKALFQIFDHCSIFLLIWGTYVPVCLSLVGGRSGWTLFGVQTVCAVVGIILNAVDFKRFKKFSLVLYVVMGWCVVANTKMVFGLIDVKGILLLLAGGIAYTAGIYFYKKKEKFFYHFIWHLFVLAGTLFHYAFVLGYCM